MRNEYPSLKKEILILVAESSDQRLQPYDLKKGLSHKLGISTHTVKEAINSLVKEGQLVFTYRDPTSYVEIPEPH